MSLSQREVNIATSIYSQFEVSHTIAAFAPILDSGESVARLIDETKKKEEGLGDQMAVVDMFWRYEFRPYVPRSVQNVQYIISALPTERLLDLDPPGLRALFEANPKAVVTPDMAKKHEFDIPTAVAESMESRYDLAFSAVVNTALATYFVPRSRRILLLNELLHYYGRLNFNFEWTIDFPDYSQHAQNNVDSLGIALDALAYQPGSGHMDIEVVRLLGMHSLYGQLQGLETGDNVYEHSVLFPKLRQATPHGVCPAKGFTGKMMQGIGELLKPHTDVLLQI